MPRRNARAAFALFSLLVFLSGCGGSGGVIDDGSFTPVPGGGSSVDVCDAASYEPNYADALGSLHRWPGFPVTVWFGTTTTAGGEELENRIRTGLDLWVSATGGSVAWTEVADRNQAQITVEMEVLDDPPDTLGITRTRFFAGDPELTSAEITVYAWRGMTASDIAELEDTGAHEFGHAIGINGHSPNRTDLMYRSGNRGRGPTANDVNTLRAAYCGFTRAAPAPDPARPRPADGRLQTTVISCPR